MSEDGNDPGQKVPGEYHMTSSLPIRPVKIVADDAATYEELVAVIPKADNDFLIGQLKAKATVEQAHLAWIETLQQRIEEKDKQLAEAKTKAAEKPAGVDPLGGVADAGTAGGDPQEDWKQAVAEKVAAGKDKASAIRAVVREDPELHAAYLASVNAG